MTDADLRELTKQRQGLLRAIRIDPNPEFGSVIERAAADDLEWLLHRIDEAIESIKASSEIWPEERRRMADGYREKKYVVASAVHSKRTLEKRMERWDATRRANISLVVSVSALVVSALGLLTKCVE